MHIVRLKLENFGAFTDTGWLEFKPGINLLVGQNNSGKSSLLTSLGENFPNDPHVSRDRFLPEDLRSPSLQIELAVSGSELRQSFLRKGGTLYWPIQELLEEIGVEAIEKALFRDREYIFKYQRTAGGFNANETGPTHGLFEGDWDHVLELTAARPSFTVRQVHTPQDNLANYLDDRWRSGCFLFTAQRHNIGQAPQQEVDRLSTDARDLAPFLHLMRGGRPQLFDKIIHHVREIVPTIHYITTMSIGTSETKILVWPTPDMDDARKSFSLANSGTGVSQVLAILTVVMTRDPSIIIIDEINSFLHPSAVKTLLRLLQTEYGYHQYIISTHSPEVISSGNASTVHLVKREGFESSVRLVNQTNIGDLRDLGDHLGVSISDVFAADHVLWVEGRTEEACFSLLRNRAAIEFPPATIISPVVATGDFLTDRRDIDLVFQIYERLSRITLPLVQSVAFSFDRENLTNDQIADFGRRAGGRVAFLPRRHLECYLLVPSAVARLINSLDDNRGEPVSTETVAAALEASAADAKYLAARFWAGDLAERTWLANVDAANLLGDVVARLTDNRVHFRKPDHSPLMMGYVLENEPASLQELIDHVKELVSLLRAA